MSVPETTPFWKRRSWIVQTGRASLAYYVAAALGFITNILAARSLGSSNFGAVVLAVSTVGFVAALLDFSLEEAVIHYGAGALERGDLGALRGLVRVSLRLDIGVGVVVFAVLVIAAPEVASFVSGGRLPSAFIVLAAIELLVSTANGTMGAVLLLSGKADLRAWALAWTAALRLGAVLVAVYGLGGGPERVLISFAVGAGAGALIEAFVCRAEGRRLWSSMTHARPVVRLRSLAAFGFHSSATTTLIAVKLALVSVILGRGAGPTQVGLLSVAMLPVTIADVSTAAIRSTVFVEQAKLAAARRFDVLKRAVKGYTIAALSVGIAAAVVGWFLLPALIPWLYGKDFEPAVSASRYLLPAAVASLALAWSKGLPASMGRPQVRTWVSLVDLSLTLVAVVALAFLGANGVALALSAAAIVLAPVWLGVAMHLLAGEETRLS